MDLATLRSSLGSCSSAPICHSHPLCDLARHCMRFEGVARPRAQTASCTSHFSVSLRSRKKYGWSTHGPSIRYVRRAYRCSMGCRSGTGWSWCCRGRARGGRAASSRSVAETCNPFSIARTNALIVHARKQLLFMKSSQEYSNV